MEPIPDNDTNPTHSRRCRWIGILRYEQWLVVLFISLLCLVTTLAIGEDRGSITFAPRFSAAVSYEDLCGLSHDQFQSMNAKQVQQWIREKYYMTAIESSSTLDNLVTAYTFNQGKTLRYVTLRNDRAFHFRQQGIENGPGFGQVVAGLGVPELVYHDNYVPVVREATYVSIGLDYPKLGVSVATGRWAQGDQENMQVRLSEDLQVHDIDCYVPTVSVEEVLRDVYQYRPDIIDKELKRRMPWPGFGALLP